MKQLAKYTNGNTSVTIFDDGTKIREYDGKPVVFYPESIDVKITNYCDMGCGFCHESSTREGLHADLNKLLDVLSDLPPGVELAIGGGNPLSHPEFFNFVKILNARGFIANLTVNQGHLRRYRDLLLYLLESNLIKGLGISVANFNFDSIKPLVEVSDNIVYHLIAGVSPVKLGVDLLTFNDAKLLLLGYKQFGFGKAFYSDSVAACIEAWKKAIPHFIGKCTMSFDNLAIKQLNIKRLLTEAGWEKFYMGDDFCFTMYVDAVEQRYAKTSRSNERKSFSECSLIDFFRTGK